MLETTTRYPIIEPRTESEGLIIYGSKETSLDILFGLYEEIKTCFNEESGYPVRLRAGRKEDEGFRFIPVDSRFVPYKEPCYKLFELYKSFLLRHDQPVDWYVGIVICQEDGGLQIIDHYTEDADFANWYTETVNPNDVPDDWPDGTSGPDPLTWTGAPSYFSLDEYREFYGENWSGLENAKWCKKCTAYIPQKSANNVCHVCNPDGPSLRNLFASQLERNFYNALTRAYPQATVFAKVGLKDVFELRVISDKLSHQEVDYMWKAHIDYLVVDSQNHRPLRAFEVDGPHHQVDSVTIKTDKYKNRICNVGGLPLIRIPDLRLDMTCDEVLVVLQDHIGN